MPVLTYRVTAVAEHLSGGYLNPSEFHEAMADWLADSARECIGSLCATDGEPADYRAEQVTVEPVDDVEQVSLILERRDVERLAAALDTLTPPGDAGSDAQPLLALLRMSLIDPGLVEHTRPELTVIPGGLPDADSPDEEREAAHLSRGNPERWSDDADDC